MRRRVAGDHRRRDHCRRGRRRRLHQTAGGRDTPEDRPFTKDLVYTRGFLEVYDFTRLAVRRGLIDRLPLPFAGKLAVRELGELAQLVQEGLLDSPSRLPPHVADISALASWLAYSNLLNRIDLKQMEIHLGSALD